MALTKVTYAMIADAAVNVQDYGAIGDGATNCTTAVQAALNVVNANGGGTVFFPAGDYLFDAGCTLYSNVTLAGETGAVIKPSASVPLQLFLGVGLSNVTVQNLTFEGTGAAATNTQRFIQIGTGSTYISIENCHFKKAREIGLVLEGCQYINVDGCTFTNNLVYGAEIRGGSSSITVSNCSFILNGNSGVATSNFGRGLVLWDTSSATVTNCIFNQNTEYGLRLYSQTGDLTANRNIAITNCTFRDNGTSATGKNDLYVYDEQGTTERVAITGCSFSTGNGNFAAVLSGENITFVGNTVKSINAQQAFGVSLFGSTNVVVSGNTFTNLAYVANFSPTVGAVSTNCTLSNNQCIGVAAFVASTVQGTGHIISGNHITHGGAGATDVGIGVTNSNVSVSIIGNTIDGFYRGMNIGSAGDYINVQNNTTLNSDDSGFYAPFQTDVTKFTCTNNNFDKAYPAVWGTIFSDGLQTFSRKQWVFTAPPSTGGINGGANVTWKVGDRVYNSAATAGQPKSWVCTVAGAPGTWTSEGNLQPT